MPLFRLPVSQSKVVHTSSLNMDELVANVKSLFFRRQYKRCANYCVKYLNSHEKELHPAYKIFLLYFAGLSNDCYARGMYSRSPLIPSTLDEAEEFFTKAQALLCEARIVTPHSFLPHAHDDHGEDSDDGGSSYKSMHRSRRSEDSISRPSTAATSVSAFSTDTDILFYDGFMDDKPSFTYVDAPKTETRETTQSHSRVPSAEPTSIFSQSSISPDTVTTSRPKPRLASFYLLRFPPSEPAPDPTPLVQPAEVVEDVPYPDEDECFHEPDHVEIYNSQLASMADMLSGHISGIHRFREQTQAAAAKLTFVAANRDGTGKRKMSPEERMERIVRGRERGWARPRFNATRYQELCELAIAEL